MHLADIMPCGYRHDPTEVSSAEVLDMATVNGARLQGRSDTGVLAVGKKADIIALDLDKPHPLSELRYPRAADLRGPLVRRLHDDGGREDLI